MFRETKRKGPVESSTGPFLGFAAFWSSAFWFLRARWGGNWSRSVVDEPLEEMPGHALRCAQVLFPGFDCPGTGAEVGGRRGAGVAFAFAPGFKFFRKRFLFHGWLGGEVAKLAQRGLFRVAHDDMIEQFDFEQLSGAEQVARDFDISFGW